MLMRIIAWDKFQMTVVARVRYIYEFQGRRLDHLENLGVDRI